MNHRIVQTFALLRKPGRLLRRAFGLTGAHLLILLSFGLAVAAEEATAQDFGRILGRTVERAVKGEVQSKVDRETRRVVRCALGDERCVQDAARRGDDVEYQDARGAAVGSVDPGGDHPLIVPYQGSRRIERKYDAYNEYQRQNPGGQDT